MSKNATLKAGFLNALIATAYIAVVALVITNGESLFGKNDSVLNGMLFLLLFVISAAVMGVTIFGRPIMWYLDGKKTEAILLVSYTLALLLIIAIIVFLILVSAST